VQVPCSPEQALSESVVVLSGTARAELEDMRFAADDTAPTPSVRQEAADTGPRAPQEPDASGVLDLGVFRARTSPGKAVVGAVALFLVGNLAVLLVAGTMGRWSMYRWVWPIEFLLAGVGLCLIMNVTASIWLLIPGAITVGNGVLFAYYALSQRWTDWTFLWPLEPLLIALAVVGSIWLAGHGRTTRRVSRMLSWMLGLAAVGWSTMLLLASLVLSWVNG